ncbi:MAG: Ig-like domain-containing protein [Solobacterium sp.]|nr:Ig-like domain-containing protein [Solobacterium sp.]
MICFRSAFLSLSLTAASLTPAMAEQECFFRITPVLSPFNTFVFVETDHPDPLSLQLYDEDSAIRNPAAYDSCLYEPVTFRYGDLAYTDGLHTDRGYLFRCHAQDADGGRLQVRQKQGRGYVDTGLTAEMPAVESPLSYLLNRFGEEDLYASLDAMQAYLDEMAVYPFGMFSDTPDPSFPEPFLSSPVYSDAAIQENYLMYARQPLFAAACYPFLLDSVSFPGLLMQAAEKLDPDVELASSYSHELFAVNGRRVYGGQGSGDDDCFFEAHMVRNPAFALASLHSLLKQYQAYADTDLEPFRINSKDIPARRWLQVIAEPILDGLKADRGYAMAGPDGTFLRNVWVEGRYINARGLYQRGARYADYPEAEVLDHKDAPDENTWVLPFEGFLYDGSVSCGTPFHHTPVTGIRLPAEYSGYVNERLVLPVEILPEDAYEKRVYYTSSDEDTLAVGLDAFIPKKPGTALVTAFSLDGHYQSSCLVTVHEHSPIRYEPLPTTFGIHETYQWNVTADGLPVTFLSENPEVAEISPTGLITTKMPGSAVLVFQCEGVYHREAIQVIDRISVQAVTILEADPLVLHIGDARQVHAGIEPADATDRSLSFSVANPAIATVDENGTVTAVNVGLTSLFVRGAQGDGDLIVIQVVSDDPAACRIFGFCYYSHAWYWYENGIRQGVIGDSGNIIDEIYHVERGREIYDPNSDGWYWLDAVKDGARASCKEVWMPYIYQDEKPGSTNGKWVRYDSSGRMIKGWSHVEDYDLALYPEQAHQTYYYDLITGAMYKGTHVIDGLEYHFDELSGALR